MPDQIITPWPPTRDWLENQYVTLERGCPEIGRMVGRDAKTVWWWLRKFEIPARTRGCTSESAANREKGHGAMRGRTHAPEAVARIRAASIARGAVPYLRDGEHWLKGAAPEDNPNWKGGTTPERQAFYGRARLLPRRREVPRGRGAQAVDAVAVRFARRRGDGCVNQPVNERKELA